MRRRRNKPGFTVVELLIALAITALMLTAIATAFNASAKSYQENEAIYKTMNSARQALLRMTTELRTADANSVSLNSPSECKFKRAGLDITYSYDSDANNLYLDTNSGRYLLCDNVTAMKFKKDTNGSGTSVEILMTVGVSDVNQTVSSAAVIRKDMKE